MTASDLKQYFVCCSLFFVLLEVDVKVPMCGEEGKANLQGRGRQVGLPGLEKAFSVPCFCYLCVRGSSLRFIYCETGSNP